MATGAPPTFRIPMMLLAAASLAALGVHLWPWQEISNLPGNGTVAYDPAICLAAYIGLVFWISSGVQESTRKALSAGAVMGVAAGLALVANVLIGLRATPMPAYVQPGLLGTVIILWGVAGLRGSRAAGSAGMGALSGLWGAMVSSLMGSVVILTDLYLSGPAQSSANTWKQYQGLAIGNTAMQGLVHSLNTATAFLLVGPLAGAIIGLVFAFFGQTPKSSAGH